MALTPTQLGTKSKTISSPNPNIRTRPNGLGRSPKMGRVQQLAPYQLGELVETPIGLRRIKGVSPITINVDLGPQSTLNAAAATGSTTFTVNAFKLQVPLAVGDVVVVGNSVDSYRETVKVSSAITTNSTGTTTISISPGFVNSHAKNDKVVIQKLPPNFPGEFVEIDELKILGDDSYAYIIPSVPKSPRYISRTGDVGNDDVKNEEEATTIDPTSNFQRYETIRIDDVVPLLNASSFPQRVLSLNFPYQLYLVGRNSDGTERKTIDINSNESSDPSAVIDGKDPMILTVKMLERGGAEHQHAETLVLGSYNGISRALKFDLPANYQTPVPLSVRKTLFANELFARMFRESLATGVEATLLTTTISGVGSDFFLSHLPSPDIETQAERSSSGFPTEPGYETALGSSVVPLAVPHPYLAVGNGPDLSSDSAVYLLLETNIADQAQAEIMHQTLQITGTVTFSDGSTSVTGIGTSFTTELSTSGRKSVIRFEGSKQNYRISSIADNTNLTLDALTPATGSGSSKKAFITSFENVPLIKGQFFVSNPTDVLNQRVEFRGTSTAGKDNAGSISGRVFLELPRGQPRWSSKRALDNGKGDETGFIDAFQSPEDQPNETFGFYVGKNEESLPFMKMSNNTGETVLDGRVKLTGYIFDAPRVEAQELKKIRQRSGFYKARLFPHTGFFPKLEDRPNGPPEGWEPRHRTIKRTLTETMSELNLEVKKQMRN